MHPATGRHLPGRRHQCAPQHRAQRAVGDQRRVQRAQFWDGRANNVFNGFSPFGNRDPDAGIYVTSERSTVASKVRLALNDASAASQAVGPPGSAVEMSCGGRTFADIGRRMLDS